MRITLSMNTVTELELDNSGILMPCEGKSWEHWNEFAVAVKQAEWKKRLIIIDIDHPTADWLYAYLIEESNSRGCGFSDESKKGARSMRADATRLHKILGDRNG